MFMSLRLCLFDKTNVINALWCAAWPITERYQLSFFQQTRGTWKLWTINAQKVHRKSGYVGRT